MNKDPQRILRIAIIFGFWYIEIDLQEFKIVVEK